MKKIILLLISVVMCVTFISCDNLENNENNGHNNGNNGNNGNNNENPINPGENNNNLNIPESLLYFQYKKDTNILEFTKTGVKINYTNYNLVKKTTEQNVTTLHFDNDLTKNFIFVIDGQLNSVTFQSLGLSGMGWIKYPTFLYNDVLYFNENTGCHIYFDKYSVDKLIFNDENNIGYLMNLIDININDDIIKYSLKEDFTGSGSFGVIPDDKTLFLYLNTSSNKMEFEYKSYEKTGWVMKDRNTYNIPLPSVLKNTTWKNGNNITIKFIEYYKDTVILSGMSENIIFINLRTGDFYSLNGNKYNKTTSMDFNWKDNTMNDPNKTNVARIDIDVKNNKLDIDIGIFALYGLYAYEDIKYLNFTKQN